jgi:hypothetical protein
MVIACLLGAFCHPADGQVPDPGASLWLHSWVPETGAIASSASPFEKSLAWAAELTRRGDIKNALSELDSIKSSDPAAGYLTKIFRREVLLRSTFAIGGFADQQSEGDFLYIRNAHEGERLTQEAAQLARQAGPSHERQLNDALHVANCFDLSAIQTVSTLRMDQINHETAELKAFATSPMGALPLGVDSRLTCAQMSFELQESQALDPVSAQLLQLLIDARYEEGRWNFTGAKDSLVKGLDLARSRAPSVAGLWLLALGDLEIAPYGSPLTFGFDSSTDSGVRVTMWAGVYSKALTRPPSDAIARAEDDYRQSNRPDAELAIRRAYIAWLRVRRNSAPAYAAAAVAAGADYPALRALSLASPGFLLADKKSFNTGLHDAQASGFSGLAISLVDMADSVASRLWATDPIRAVDVLDFAAIGASREGLPASAARLELSLAVYNNALRRSDFAVDAWERAVTHIESWMAEIDRTVGQENLNSSLLPGVRLVQRQLLIGVLVELAGALNEKYFEEGREEWRTRRDYYEAEVRQLLPDANEKSQERWNQYLKDRESYSALATNVARIHAGGCDAAKEIYLAAKRQSTGNPVVWAPFSAVASVCDPALREDALSSLTAYDPISVLRAAVGNSVNHPGFAAKQQLQAAIINLSTYLDVLVSLGGGTTIVNCVNQLSALVQANPSLIGWLDPSAELYRAIALGIEGRNTDSRELLLKLRSVNSSSNADPFFRRRIDSALVEADAGLQDAAAALVTLESLQSEVQELQTLASGVSAGDSDTVRLTMLLRQQAISEIPLKEQQEITALEAHFRPAAIGQGSGLADVRAIIDRIPTGVVVLAYYPARTNMLIWRLERGKPPLLWHSTATPWAISQMAADLSRKLLDQVAGWEVAAADLYHELVEPAGLLNSGVTVAISGMPSVPFDLLAPTGGPPLIHDHPIVYVASLASPDDKKTAATGTASLVVGAMGAGLDQVEPEVQKVAMLLHTTPLLGPDATLSRVRAALPSASFVHIASHGVIDPVNPYRSYLALSDGNLEAWELFHSAANAQLVVFSACDTLRSIQRSFSDDPTTIAGLTTLGGAPRVVSSLWAADDKDTRQLMTMFYQALETNPAIALQKAKIAFGRVYRSSNFILTVADPSVIVFRSQP